MARSFLLALVGVLALPALAPAQSFPLSTLVDTTTTEPGTGGTFSFSNTDLPAVGTTGLVAFATADLTVWTVKTDGTALTRVLGPDTAIPGRTGTFQQAYGQSIQIFKNTVVFVGLACAGCDSGTGLYKVAAIGGRVVRLVDMHTAVPGGTGTFGAFPMDFNVSSTGLATDAYVAFQDNQQLYAVPLLGGGAPNPVAGSQDAGHSPPDPYCCIAATPSVRADSVALAMGNVFGRWSILTASRTGDVTSFVTIADGSTHPPHTPASYHFDDFTLSLPVSDRRLVFHGMSISPTRPDPFDGIYAKTPTGMLRLVDTSMAVPGGAGNFRGGGFQMIAAGNGVVVFWAQDENGNPGLYAVKETGGTVYKIVAVGDLVGPYTVGSVSIGRQAMAGNRLAMLIGYTNFQGAGIYTTNVVLP